MIIVNALLLMLTSTGLTDAYSSFHELTTKLDRQVEWIDKYGSHIRHRSAVKKTLNKLVASLHQPVYTLRHESEWKNGQCFRIIHIDDATTGYRIFFQCKRQSTGDCLVTKIKVTERYSVNK